ncbi:hypothetical protein AAC387_Pa08g2049 [Persea americana]
MYSLTIFSPSPLQNPSLSSKTQTLGFRPQSHLLRCPQRNPKIPISCSISQVHSYGTVDYEKRPILKWSHLYRRISMMENPSLGSATILEQWEEEGRKLTKWDLCRVVKELRKYRRFKPALEIYEWMSSQGERFRLNTSDTAIQLDLISKVHGVSSAEEYFSMIPDALKDKRTHGALLNAYAQATMKEKAEDLMDRMIKGGFAKETLPYNVMMTLYMNLSKYESVILMINTMRESNVPLDIYSYNIWITTCAAMEDTEEMERVVDEMRQDSGINANWTTYSTLASMYIKLGHFEKAENCLKDVELRITGRDREPFNYLISLYSSIGKKEDVFRIWNYYKSSFPSIQNIGYKSILSSLVRLGDIMGAEEIYREWMSCKSGWDPRISNILMGWYIKEGLITKAENFLDQMHEAGLKPNSNTWELLAEGHLKEKQVSKAVSCIKEAALVERELIWRPKPTIVAALLSLCKEQADTASLEVLMEVLRRAGCLEMEEYKTLIRTNVKSGRAVDA